VTTPLREGAGVGGISSDLYLGLDGGGTRTMALLASAQQVLGYGEAGPANLQAVGQAAALKALDEAVRRAFATAGFERVPVAAACLGLAGAGRPEEQDAVRNWAQKVNLAQRIEITTDAALLLPAGTPDGWGVALIAGTGSMALARSPDGATARAGGWGYLLGDEGSGYALALGALQAVARADDGRGPATRMTDNLLGELRLSRAADLIGWLYGAGRDRAAFAGLAPLVLRTAEEGDAVARTIVSAAADELADIAFAAAKKLGFESEPVPLTLAGGLLLGSASYRERVLTALSRRGFLAQPVTLVQEPAQGAVRLALAAAGLRQIR
jgi:N-acetylglucosamine kinase-like BadF-type ATPase